MSGFQVANFTFGKNIVDANIERARMALQNEQSIRSASLQERAQNISRDENRARLEESALQREENARQFDEKQAENIAERIERSRQFDENNKLRNKQFEASRLDAERANYWDDAIKNQQIEINYQKFLTQNEELKRIMMIRQQEEDQMAHRKELIESSYGNAVIACELGGGFMSQGQIDDFNKSNGTDYNYVGKIDMSTGRQFSDGKIHFVKYDIDSSGHVIFDKATGRPMVSIDNPISKEFYTCVIGTYLGDMKNIYSRNGSGLTFDERMALQEAKNKGRLSSGSSSGKFSSDQVQYFVNKQRELSSELSDLDPRNAEHKKRIYEINAEIEYLKAGERLAAIQGLNMQGAEASAQQNSAKLSSDPVLGIIGKHTENPDQNQKKRGYPDENKSGSSSSDETDKYTTQLDDNEESAYQKWRSKLPKELQYEGDYDLRGFWKENGDKELKSGDHMPDKFKKPNHKTFSVESKYATGEDFWKAGRWDGENFIPANDEKEVAWKKWYIENARKGDDPKVLRKRFEEYLDFDNKVKEKLKDGRDPGFLNNGR